MNEVESLPTYYFEKPKYCNMLHCSKIRIKFLSFYIVYKNYGTKFTINYSKYYFIVGIARVVTCQNKLPIW